MRFFKSFVVSSILVYVLAAAGGALSYNTPGVPSHQQSTQLVDTSKTKLELFVTICMNNLTVVAINLSGIFSLGVIAFVSTAYNGFVFGRLVAFASDFFGWSSLVSHLLPHITELVAIVLSCAIAFAGAYDLFCYLKDDSHAAKIAARRYAGHIGLCAIIVVFSALMEAYVSVD